MHGCNIDFGSLCTFLHTPKVTSVFVVYCTPENCIGKISQMVTRLPIKLWVWNASPRRTNFSPFLYFVKYELSNIFSENTNYFAKNF